MVKVKSLKMSTLRTGRKFSSRERQCSDERIRASETNGRRLPNELDKNTVNSKSLDVYVDIDPSLKGWTENSEFSYKIKKHLNSKRESMDSIYCEVLNNGTCHECQTNERKSASINSSLAKFPNLETGGYLLFQSLREKQKFPERTTYSALSFASSAETSYSSSETSGSLRQQVRAASAVLSNFNRRATESARSFSQARPMTSRNVRFEDVSRNNARSFSSRGSARKVSAMSQEGWSEKQIEAWKLLAPTPPQIEVSQMNVSMYTPKELPGIKIFDESLFVI